MSSIDSPEIIQTILSHEGTYPGDRQCQSVWSYLTDWSTTCYKLCYHPTQEDEFLASPFVHLPRRLWSKSGGLTPAAISQFPSLELTDN